MAIYTNILTGGSNSHETTSENANQLSTDFISEGIVGAITNTAGVAPATGGFAVNAQDTPDMTVAISAGVAYVTATPSGQASQTLRVYNNASANVTISANSSGSTKYDWIYISISAANAANPNTAGDDVATFVASRSSSASVDDGTPPTYGYALAVVTVVNGENAIEDGMITDIRVLAESVQDGSVGNDKLATTTGEIGAAWQSWTPTLTNVTLGSGTIVAKYLKIGKLIHYRISFIYSSSTVSGLIGFSLPVTAASSMATTTAIIEVGEGRILDSGTQVYYCSAALGTTTRADVYVRSVSTYVIRTNTSGTVPMTWANNDEFFIEGFYEAA